MTWLEILSHILRGEDVRSNTNFKCGDAVIVAGPPDRPKTSGDLSAFDCSGQSDLADTPLRVLATKPVDAAHSRACPNCSLFKDGAASRPLRSFVRCLVGGKEE
jgi:hypothetical protein